MFSQGSLPQRTFKFLFCFLFLTGSANYLFAQHILRTDPPFWYQGMKNRHLQVLILCDAALPPGLQVSSDNESVNLNLQYRQPENKKYIILEFDVPVMMNTPFISFQILFNAGKRKGTLTFDYEIRARRLSGPVDGVGPEDLVYLLMPDRFSNGNPANDHNATLQEKRADRLKPKGRHGGDIQGIIDHLDYLAGLGVTAIWPTPLYTNDQPSESYHGYAISDHYAIDPRYGDLKLYLQLKSEAEKRHIKMVQDFIYNHTGNRHYLFMEKPAGDWFNQWDTFTRTNYKASALNDPYASEADRNLFSKGWFDRHMPDLNQKNPDLARYLIQNTLWWIETAGLNGIRIDTYTYPDQEFMNKLIRELLDEYPTLGIFGETWVQGNAQQAFFVQPQSGPEEGKTLPGVTDFQLNFAFNRAFTTEFGWTDGLSAIYHALAEDFLYRNPQQNVIFLDNHDMSRFYSVCGENADKLKMAVALLMTTRGIPCLYYGTEILMKNFSNPDALVREDFPGGWPGDILNKFTPEGRTAKENEFFGFTGKLANYRKNSEVLQTGGLKQFVPVNGVYVYFRYKEKNKKIMVILNQSGKPQTIRPGRFSEILLQTDTAKEIISGKTYTFERDFEIGAQSVLILEIE